MLKKLVLSLVLIGSFGSVTGLSAWSLWQTKEEKAQAELKKQEAERLEMAQFEAEVGLCIDKIKQSEANPAEYWQWFSKLSNTQRSLIIAAYPGFLPAIIVNTPEIFKQALKDNAPMILYVGSDPLGVLGMIPNKNKKNIVGLVAGNCKITDKQLVTLVEQLSPVNLQTLYLNGGCFTETTLLESFINLKTLSLDNNKITDFDFLSKFKYLKKLYLGENSIKDISFLRGVENLEILDLSQNAIEDISSLVGLAQLKVLHLENNLIKTIDALGVLLQLEQLNLDNNKITEFASLSQLGQLKHLFLNECSLRDLTPLASLKQLVVLAAGGNQLVNIEPLRHLDSLEVLGLNNNEIRDVSPLASLTKLKKLYLMANPHITNFSPLGNLIRLEHLSFQRRQAASIKFMEKLVNLTPNFDDIYFDSSFINWNAKVGKNFIITGKNILFRNSTITTGGNVEITIVGSEKGLMVVDNSVIKGPINLVSGELEIICINGGRIENNA